MQTKGHYHPITRFIDKSMQIFEELGFCVIEGPELESEWYNFDFLRVASDHPARDVQDTFWISGSKNKKLNVMRTHMTTVQGRAIKNVQPPCRFVMPGRVFRNENTDSTHESVFYQLDVVAIGESINLSQMIFCLHEFLKKLLTSCKIEIKNISKEDLASKRELALINFKKGSDKLQELLKNELYKKDFYKKYDTWLDC